MNIAKKEDILNAGQEWMDKEMIKSQELNNVSLQGVPNAQLIEGREDELQSPEVLVKGNPCLLIF